jgi:signal transduction histidine kinase
VHVGRVIDFPLAPREGSAAAKLLDAPPLHTHAVQFYEDVDPLYDAVGKFLTAGLAAGDQIVVIATSEHRDGFAGRLAPDDLARAIATEQLTLLDARATLAKFMVDGMPDRGRFRALADELVAMARRRAPDARLRAYGEMVDLLWREGNSNAAIRLEELWEETVKENRIALLCAYVMGNFYKEGDSARFMEVCRHHSHVIPTEQFTNLEDPHARLREISLLQQRARALESEILNRRELESALREALKERSKVEQDLRDALEREHAARRRAEENEAFKEEFVAILGHDLRNPLSTILTTTRLMTMRKELPAETQRRLERVTVSGVRMERMIDQILDLARARLGSGIQIRRQATHDVVALVTKIVDELRVANPTRRIDVRSEGVCRALVDADRLEQVVSNLVGNAIAHGDPDQPITVAVGVNAGMLTLTIHNHGSPIDPAFVPVLFDPFKRATKSAKRSEGLGLGLYISERIVSAHGGTIDVVSSAEEGTSFRVTLPCG